MASSCLTLMRAYDTGGAGWKMENDAVVLDGSGNPVYVDASGREMSVEHGTIARLNGEAKGHRERAEAAETKLKSFEGITDPAAALKALETVGKLDAKSLIDAGKVDEVKAEITKTYEQRLADVQKTADTYKGQIDNMLVDGAFKGSEFLRDNIAVPADLIQAAFANRFKPENGKLVPYGADGQPVYSPKRVGEIADFDEALALFIEGRSDRDVLLKAPDARGSGNNGGGGNRGGGRIVKRADFDQMQPAQQAELAGKMGSGEIKIVD